MKPFKISFVLLFVVSSAFIFNIFAKETKLKDYYPLDQENFWLYDVNREGEVNAATFLIRGTEKINNVDTVKNIVDNNEETIYYLAVDSEGGKKYKKVPENDESTIYSSPVMVLPFNIENSSYQQKYSGHDMKITFEGRENVSTLAGNFSNCIKVKVIYNVDTPNGGFTRIEETLWYAENIGLVKKEEYDMEFSASDGALASGHDEWILVYARVGGKIYGDMPSEEE